MALRALRSRTAGKQTANAEWTTVRSLHQGGVQPIAFVMSGSSRKADMLNQHVECPLMILSGHFAAREMRRRSLHSRRDLSILEAHVTEQDGQRSVERQAPAMRS
jgi:hypothetical protein